MTIQQAGLAAFRNAKGQMLLDRKVSKRSAEQVLRGVPWMTARGSWGF